MFAEECHGLRHKERMEGDGQAVPLQVSSRMDAILGNELCGSFQEDARMRLFLEGQQPAAGEARDRENERLPPMLVVVDKETHRNRSLPERRRRLFGCLCSLSVGGPLVAFIARRQKKHATPRWTHSAAWSLSVVVVVVVEGKGETQKTRVDLRVCAFLTVLIFVLCLSHFPLLPRALVLVPGWAAATDSGGSILLDAAGATTPHMQTRQRTGRRARWPDPTFLASFLQCIRPRD